MFGTLSMMKLSEVEIIGEAYAGKLLSCGLMTQEQLLDLGATPLGRQTLSEESGINPRLIMKWVNRADLSRIEGVNSEYSGLLEHSGVASVPELAMRTARSLYDKMVDVNKQFRLVRNVPPESEIFDWVQQAKGLGRAVHY